MGEIKIRSRYHFSTTHTDPFLRVRFLFLRGGDERDISPVGHAAHAATLHAHADESIYETRADRQAVQRRPPVPVRFEFRLVPLLLWRVLERRGAAEPLVYSSTRHSAKCKDSFL